MSDKCEMRTTSFEIFRCLQNPVLTTDFADDTDQCRSKEGGDGLLPRQMALLRPQLLPRPSEEREFRQTKFRALAP